MPPPRHNVPVRRRAIHAAEAPSRDRRPVLPAVHRRMEHAAGVEEPAVLGIQDIQGPRAGARPAGIRPRSCPRGAPAGGSRRSRSRAGRWRAGGQRQVKRNRAQGARPSPPQTDALRPDAVAAIPGRGWPVVRVVAGPAAVAPAACRKRRGTTPHGLPTPLVRMGSAPHPQGGEDPRATGASRIGAARTTAVPVCQANRAAVDTTRSRCAGRPPRRRPPAPARRARAGSPAADRRHRPRGSRSVPRPRWRGAPTADCPRRSPGPPSPGWRSRS